MSGHSLYLLLITICFRFVANEAGTFWYHSHQGMQKMDGLFGAVIVYDPVKPSYPSFTLVFNDLLHAGAVELSLSVNGPDQVPATYLRMYKHMASFNVA